MTSLTLPAKTSMGAVTLMVASLDAMTAYYTGAIGLEVIAESGNSTILGTDDKAVMILEHSPALKHAGQHEAGLFHTAFLYKTEADLAWAVASVASKHNTSFTGSADHLVSKAFYFNDPEGNGVELYFDRDRTDWSWKHGQIEMATLGLDPNAFLTENLNTEITAAASTIGHVHLSVGSIAEAQDFYVSKLGFETTLNWGGTALFVSAGGYHHHMAMNVWQSRGAGRRQPSLGLGEVAIELPSIDEVAAVGERLILAGLQIQDDGKGIALDDPWGNKVRILAS
jgi:catechol 2,3-dioxygenase